MGVGPARVGGCALVLELDTLGWVGACGEHSEPKVREGGAGRQRTGLAPVFTQNKRLFMCTSISGPGHVCWPKETLLASCSLMKSMQSVGSEAVGTLEARVNRRAP